MRHADARGRQVLALALLVCAVLAPTSAALAAPGAAPPDPANPEAVQQQVRDVMDRSEFSYEKSLMERFGDWLAEQLDRVFPDMAGGAGGSTFGGGIGMLVAYVLIVVALAGVMAAVIYVVIHRVRRVDVDDDEATETEIEHQRSADAWQADARDHEAAREWKEAIRARYRLLVRTLVDREQLPDIAGRTTRELRVDLTATTPAAQAAFDTASLLFELPWYADVPTGPEENARFRAAAEEVLAA